MKLLSCSACACVVKESERACPDCGFELRRADGSIPATAAAIVLGLVVGVSACGTATPEYGVPGTGGDPSGGSGGSGGEGLGGEGAGGNMTGGGETPVYGVAGSSGAP